MQSYQQTKNTQGAEGHEWIRGADTKNQHVTVNPLIDWAAPELPASYREGPKFRVSTWHSAVMCHAHSVTHNRGSAPAAPQREHHKSEKNKE